MKRPLRVSSWRHGLPERELGLRVRTAHRGGAVEAARARRPPWGRGAHSGHVSTTPSGLHERPGNACARTTVTVPGSALCQPPLYCSSSGTRWGTTSDDRFPLTYRGLSARLGTCRHSAPQNCKGRSPSEEIGVLGVWGLRSREWSDACSPSGSHSLWTPCHLLSAPSPLGSTSPSLLTGVP